MHDAKEVANYLLDRAEERDLALTNMELIKHIYFAHGWHLATKNEPLIHNRIEAWEYGPVVRTVYECFKSAGSTPVRSRALRLDLTNGELVIAQGDFSQETAALLCSSLEYYSGYGAFELSAISHEPGGPWDCIWNAADRRVRLNMEISDAAIREHFVGQLKSTTIQ